MNEFYGKVVYTVQDCCVTVNIRGNIWPRNDGKSYAVTDTGVKFGK